MHCIAVLTGSLGASVSSCCTPDANNRYSLYNMVVDAPMYYARYRADEAHNKTYFPFIEGLEDAAHKRIVTHDLKDCPPPPPSHLRTHPVNPPCDGVHSFYILYVISACM